MQRSYELPVQTRVKCTNGSTRFDSSGAPIRRRSPIFNGFHNGRTTILEKRCLQTCVGRRLCLVFGGFQGILVPRNLVPEVESTVFRGFISPGSSVAGSCPESRNGN